MDGYDIVENYFKEWIESQSFIGRYYVAIFLAKRSNISFEQYECLCEPFEYDYDGFIIWEYDWCEGEDDITDLRFYSLNDIKKIIIDAEKHHLETTLNTKWFNAWR